MPPTAAGCLLSIDGGGTRGVATLEFLDILQDILGPHCPIQKLFDLAFGTSSGVCDLYPPILPPSPPQGYWLIDPGGLIVLGLFLRQLGVAQCKSMFDKLSREVFGDHRRNEGGVWRSVRRLLRCWMSDGYYDTAFLETILKQLLGAQQRMFGSRSSTISTKVAVVATTISDALPVVLSNYNGVRTRQSDCGECFSRIERRYRDRNSI